MLTSTVTTGSVQDDWLNVISINDEKKGRRRSKEAWNSQLYTWWIISSVHVLPNTLPSDRPRTAIAFAGFLSWANKWQFALAYSTKITIKYFIVSRSSRLLGWNWSEMIKNGQFLSEIFEQNVARPRKSIYSLTSYFPLLELWVVTLSETCKKWERNSTE